MKFKDDVTASRFDDLHDLAKMIAKEMDQYASDHYGVELLLTATVSTAEEDKLLGRESDTHRTRRAFDIRTHNLPEALVTELCAVFGKKFGKYGAVASGKANLIVNKPHGTGPHLHVQLNRKYVLPLLTYKGN